MSIRSILAPLTSSTERQSAVLETATALASRHRASLEVVYLKAEPAAAFRSRPNFSVDAANIAERYQSVRDGIAEQCQAMRGSLAALCERYGVRMGESGQATSTASAAWTEMVGDSHDAMARFGRFADLIVVGRPDSERDRIILEFALLSTGRAVLMIPGWSGSLPGRRIAVAVNDSLEAARAMAAALPFLEAAEAVTILTAQSARTEAAVAERARTYLAHHEVAAEVRIFDKNDEPPVGKALLGHCRKLSADMLVMGAYTHSRAHQLLLGGVTSHMVACADRAVLMVH